MATFVLIPGAGGAAWSWHLVVRALQARSHRAVAVDLPADDDEAGLTAYARTAAEAAPVGAREVVVVGQSMGGFTVPMVAVRRPVAGLVLLNAMLPLPGETAGAWWDAVGSEDARVTAARAGGYPEQFDLDTYFLHDVPPEFAAAGAAHARPEADVAFSQPCAFERWPDVPTVVLTSRDDRFFPYDFQARVAHERLGLDVVPVPGGHLAALSQPEAIAAAADGIPV